MLLRASSGSLPVCFRARAFLCASERASARLPGCAGFSSCHPSRVAGLSSSESPGISALPSVGSWRLLLHGLPKNKIVFRRDFLQVFCFRLLSMLPAPFLCTPSRGFSGFRGTACFLFPFRRVFLAASCYVPARRQRAGTKFLASISELWA